MSIENYLKLPYKMEIVPEIDESGFVVSFPELPGCISCGFNIEETIKNALDAKKAWLEAMLEAGKEIPMPNNIEDYSGQFKLRIPKSLHKQLAEQSRHEGISMNQYCLYLLTRNEAIVSLEK